MYKILYVTLIVVTVFLFQKGRMEETVMFGQPFPLKLRPMHLTGQSFYNDNDETIFVCSQNYILSPSPAHE